MADSAVPMDPKDQLWKKANNSSARGRIGTIRNTANPEKYSSCGKCSEATWFVLSPKTMVPPFQTRNAAKEPSGRV